MSTKRTLEELVDSPTFCTLAWTGLSISPSGAVTPCCLFEEPIKSGEKACRIYQDEVPTFYNNSFMRDIRKKMFNAEPVSGCRQCYENEKYGGISLRVRSNRDVSAVKDEYSLDEKEVPQLVDLKLNNKCNLKCRMCQPRDSHQIYNEFSNILNEDPEFRFFQNANLTDPELNIDIKNIPNWEDDPDFYEKLKELLPSIKKLSLVGGEPLILEQLYKLLDLIIDEGHADHIFLTITTNLMTLRKDRIKDYFQNFDKVMILVSLDAIGHELNYIRYPSDFNKIDANFRDIYEGAKLPGANVFFGFALTIQLYNALYLSDIFFYIETLYRDEYEFPENAISFTYLSFPEHLHIKNLPPKLRALAKLKLQSFYKESRYLTKHPIFVKAFKHLLGVLSEEPADNYKEELRSFLYYTETLDNVRNQRFEESLPELYRGIKDLRLSPKKPKPNYHQLREEGWRFARENNLAKAAEMFNLSLKTSINKDLDLRELGWIYMLMNDIENSMKSYAEGYKLNPNDKFIAKGYAICAGIQKDKGLLGEVLPRAEFLNPGDGDLKELRKAYIELKPI